MNESQQINKQKINNLHETALRLLFCDHSSNSQELLERDNAVTIHRIIYIVLIIYIIRVLTELLLSMLGLWVLQILLSTLSGADPVLSSYANDEVVFPPYEMLKRLKIV